MNINEELVIQDRIKKEFWEKFWIDAAEYDLPSRIRDAIEFVVKTLTHDDMKATGLSDGVHDDLGMTYVLSRYEQHASKLTSMYSILRDRLGTHPELQYLFYDLIKWYITTDGQDKDAKVPDENSK